MKTFKLFAGIIATVASTMLSSCLKGNDTSYVISNTYPSLFSAVIDNQTNEMTIYSGQSVKIDWNYTESTATMQLNGLKLPDGVSFPMLTFNDVKWDLNNRGWMRISLTDRTPDTASGFVSNLVFTRFNLETVNRAYNNITFPPCFYLNYTVNNQYNVYTLPCEMIEVGDTKVTDQNGNTFTQSEKSRAIYYIELDPANRKGFLVIQGAQFAEGMPALNMKFPGIPFEVAPNGSINMAIDELTPALLSNTNDVNSAGTPAPSYPITNLRLVYNPLNGVVITFTCTPHTKDGKEMGKYNVVFSCDFPSLNNTPS